MRFLKCALVFEKEQKKTLYAAFSIPRKNSYVVNLLKTTAIYSKFENTVIHTNTRTYSKIQFGAIPGGKYVVESCLKMFS